MYACMYLCFIYVYVYCVLCNVCMYTYVCMYLCIVIYVCILLHRYLGKPQSGVHPHPNHYRVMPSYFFAGAATLAVEYRGLGPRLVRLGPGGGIMLVAFNAILDMLKDF